jgi:hypothetical protein
MPDLSITVEKAVAVPYAVSPTLAFELRVANANPNEAIHTVVLRCQIQVEVARRRYTALDQARLRDLFGEPQRWGQTLRTMLWTHANAVIPPFQGSTTVQLHVPCTFDFNIAATKYFNGLADGEIPLCVIFSGTVFYSDKAGSVQVAPISWDKEARFRLALQVWKEMMDLYYPNSAWLCLRKDVFEQLQDYKMKHSIPTWEEAIERILAPAEGPVKEPEKELVRPCR